MGFYFLGDWLYILLYNVSLYIKIIRDLIVVSLVIKPLSSVFFLHPHEQKIFRAMYDYMAADADEVSFKDGDAIVNVQAIDEGWMYGTVQRTGRTGMLPANYVEAI